jgi:DNA invertase Pin-like site-specific DNA recombinase
MTNTVRAYCRASTKTQDASRAKEQMEAFAVLHGRPKLEWYVENVSGATLERPQLMRLLESAHEGDILLLEQIDRLTRLTAADWDSLKLMIQKKGVVVVSIDLPTSYGGMADLTIVPKDSQEAFTHSMLRSVNAMLMDMLGAVARKDYEDRRRRQDQGIEKAQAEGKFKGRQPDLAQHERIRKLLAAGLSYTDIQESLKTDKGCPSRATIAKIAKATAAA